MVKKLRGVNPETNRAIDKWLGRKLRKEFIAHGRAQVGADDPSWAHANRMGCVAVSEAGVVSLTFRVKGVDHTANLSRTMRNTDDWPDLVRIAAWLTGLSNDKSLVAMVQQVVAGLATGYYLEMTNSGCVLYTSQDMPVDTISF